MYKDFLFTPLLDRLISYSNKPKTPFHMPGHAGGRGIHPKIKEFFGDNIFKADLTELDELDNLSDPHGVIKEAQEKIAGIFNARASYFLINGSTLGLMALILSVAGEEDRVLVPRNCHRAVINALILTGAEPIWYLPEWLSEWQLYGKVSTEKFDDYLDEYPEIKAALVVNPSYEGIVSNTGGLATLCQKYEIPLIVDEAHGGHWRFSDELPEDAIASGADAVVQSLHKSCGSLSQSSLLHLSKSSKFSKRVVEENLRLLQSTSPSYILMASLDAASSFLISEEGRQILQETHKASLELREKLKEIESIRILESSSKLTVDPTRLFVSINNLTGDTLANIIEFDYRIAIESFNNYGNLFFLNIGNTAEDFEKLYLALKDIAGGSYGEKVKVLPEPKLPKMKLSCRKAFFSDSESLPIKNAIGRIARYPVVKCPPGICMLIPGEVITEHHLNFFREDEQVEVTK